MIVFNFKSGKNNRQTYHINYVFNFLSVYNLVINRK